MSAFEEGAGISLADIGYIIVPSLVVATIIVVSMGFIEALKLARVHPESETMDLYARLLKGIAAIIALIALIYFVTQN